MEKNKISLLFIVTLFFTIVCNGQIVMSFREFAPVGAKWSYDVLDEFGGIVNFYSEKDTLISGKKCKKIASNGNLTYYIHQDSLKFYEYEMTNNQFVFLYDLGLKVGDTLYSKKNNVDAILIKIDTLYRVGLKYTFKEIYNTHLDKCTEHPYEEIINSIGSIQYIIPWHECPLTEPARNFRLRCYTDGELTYKMNENIECGFWLDLSTHTKERSPETQKWFDLQGREIKSENYKGVKIGSFKNLEYEP